MVLQLIMAIALLGSGILMFLAARYIERHTRHR